MLNNNILNIIKVSKDTYQNPQMIFDLQIIKDNINKLLYWQKFFDINFLVPVKAVANSYILELINSNMLGFDVSNEQEFNLLPNKINNNILYTNPILTEKDLDFLRNKNNDNIIINIDSYEQLKILSKYNKIFKICLRIDFSEIETGLNISKSRFGLNFIDLQKCIEYIIKNKFKIEGLHLHNGIYFFDFIQYSKYISYLLDINSEYALNISFINLGGGLSYINKNKQEDFLHICRNVCPIGIKLYFEPGKFISYKSGIVISKILNIKREKDVFWIFMDISKECHLKWIEPILLTKLKPSLIENGVKVIICGATCFEYDIIGTFIFAKEQNMNDVFYIGNILIFKNIDFYASAWNVSFNGINKIEVKYV